MLWDVFFKAVPADCTELIFGKNREFKDELLREREAG